MVAGRLQHMLTASGEGVRDLQRQCGVESKTPSKDELSMKAMVGGIPPVGSGMHMGGGSGSAADSSATAAAAAAAAARARSAGPVRSRKLFVPVSQDEFESVSELCGGV